MKYEKKTFCRLCDICCGMIATVEDGRITHLRPNPDHVASQGFACPKGLAYHEIVHSPDRLTTPVKRTGAVNAPDSWVEQDWDSAIGEIGAKLRAIIDESGPESVALYVGTGAGFAFLHPYWAQGFLEGTGSKNLYSSATQDCSNKFVACREMYGFPMLHPVTDFENGQCFIVLGGNPAATKLSFKGVPHAMRRFREASEAGCRIVHVNPRRTEAADAGGEHLSIRPDTDVYFLLAFAGELLRLGAVDRPRVDAYMKNLDDLERICAPWTPERQAEVTGIPADSLRELAASFAAADGASMYLSTGLAMGRRGAICAWLVEAVNAFTGNLDRRGGTLVGKGSLMDFPRLGAKFGIMMSGTRSRLGNYRVVNEIMPGTMLAEEILTPGKGKIRALFVAGGNPFITLPNTARVEKAFLNLDLLVTVDLFRNLTGAYSHWVLPGLASYERPDLGYIFQSMMGITDKRFLQYTDAVVPAPGEARDELLIWQSLCKAAGLKFFGTGFLQGLIDFRAVLSRMPGFLGKPFRFSHERILDRFLKFSGKPGVRRMRRRPDGLELKEMPPGSFLGRRVRTKDGKVNLAPVEFVSACADLDEQFEADKITDGRLRLVNKRGFRTLNSFLQSSPTLMKGRHGSNHIHIHPDDAARRRLEDGGDALVWSDWGCIRVPVKVTDRMSPGSVAVPFGWGQQRAAGFGFAATLPGANVNWLTPSGADHMEELSLMAHLSGLPVEAAPVPAGTPAVVLAGGRSSRFGSDKAFAEIDGRPLLDRVLGAAEEAGLEAVLSLSAAAGFEGYSRPRIYDPDPELASPLNGLLAAARVLPGSFLVLTVDNPGISAAVIRLLLAAAAERGGHPVSPGGDSGTPGSGPHRPVVIGNGRRLFPFPGVYHAAHLDAFEAARFSGDYRLTELVETLDPVIVEVDDVAAVDPELRCLTNVNTPADLAALA